MLNKIEGITLSVSDIKRSAEFYRDILGLRVNKESEDKVEFSRKDSTNTKLILESEQIRIKNLEQKYENDMKVLRNEMNNQ